VIRQEISSLTNRLRILSLGDIFSVQLKYLEQTKSQQAAPNPSDLILYGHKKPS
jgi:hypothetical protein